jgi:hypothetical protein
VLRNYWLGAATFVVATKVWQKYENLISEAGAEVDYKTKSGRSQTKSGRESMNSN